MARQVFFSFNYTRDIFRVNVVRKSGFTQSETGFVDHSLWEATKSKGDAALQKLIDDGLYGASVTAVLIGAQTAGRKWIDYEIQKSWNDGKAVIGIRIHKIKNQLSMADVAGSNPFANFKLQDGALLSQKVKMYDWVDDDGYHNLSSWVDAAAAAKGK